MKIRVWKTSICYHEFESVPSFMRLVMTLMNVQAFLFVWIFVLLVGCWLLSMCDVSTFGRSDN